MLQQLSVFVENKQGRMAEITALLGSHNIDIRAVSISDTTDYGILRLIVDKPEQAVQLLKEHGMTVSLTNVIAVAVEDVPGALAKAVSVLSEQQIDINYMYAFLNPQKAAACVIMRVEDHQKAAQVLRNNGIQIMLDEDVKNL